MGKHADLLVHIRVSLIAEINNLHTGFAFGDDSGQSICNRAKKWCRQTMRFEIILELRNILTVYNLSSRLVLGDNIGVRDCLFLHKK